MTITSGATICGSLVVAFVLGSKWQPELVQYQLDIPPGLIEPDLPLDRPVTNESVALGRRLFSEMRLSVNDSMSCATCHIADRAFSEPHATSISADGRDRLRNAPSILNAGYLPTLDWDGRFTSLEEQIDGVFGPYGDMGIGIADAVSKIAADPEYQELFGRTFGRPVNVNDFRAALADFQRTRVSGGSRFDEYLFEEKPDALTPLEKEGWSLFIGKAGCIACHDVFHASVNSLGGGLALFTDHRFHNLGVGYANGRMADTGRFEVTRDPSDWGAFKTPGLRNVELTAPYMHDGSLKTLKEVVEFYNGGGEPNPNLSAGIKPLHLSGAEEDALVAFLCSLTN